MYLYKRGSHSSRGQNYRDGAPVIEVSTDKDFEHGGMISPFSNKSGMPPGFCETNYNGKNRNSKDNVERDVESGRIGAIPESVVISTPNTTAANVGTTDNEYGMHGLRIVQKYFQRPPREQKKIVAPSAQQKLTWKQIREEGSPCSSGLAPASIPSPMFSPVLVKGLSALMSNSTIGKKLGTPRAYLTNDFQVRDEPALEPSATQESSSIEEAIAKSINSNNTRSDRSGNARSARSNNSRSASSNHSTRSPVREIYIEKKSSKDTDFLEGSSGMDELINVDSMSSAGSSVDWGIDVTKSTSAPSFEDNVSELKNLLISIKSLGSGEESAGVVKASESSSSKDEVHMSYSRSPSSAVSRDRTSAASNVKNELSPSSEATAESSVFGNIGDIMMNDTGLPMESPRAQLLSPITYEKQLQTSSLMEEGTFSFRNLLNDPNNELYECHAPSGPMGIVIDTTPLGPRVKSLNPLSPLFGIMSPGDIIVGVDDVDTVGMEAGVFWSLVSRKANQAERVLTMLKI